MPGGVSTPERVVANVAVAAEVLWVGRTRHDGVGLKEPPQHGRVPPAAVEVQRPQRGCGPLRRLKAALVGVLEVGGEAATSGPRLAEGAAELVPLVGAIRAGLEGRR